MFNKLKEKFKNHPKLKKTLSIIIKIIALFFLGFGIMSFILSLTSCPTQKHSNSNYVKERNYTQYSGANNYYEFEDDLSFSNIGDTSPTYTLEGYFENNNELFYFDSIYIENESHYINMYYVYNEGLEENHDIIYSVYEYDYYRQSGSWSDTCYQTIYIESVTSNEWNSGGLGTFITNNSTIVNSFPSGMTFDDYIGGGNGGTSSEVTSQTSSFNGSSTSNVFDSSSSVTQLESISVEESIYIDNKYDWRSILSNSVDRSTGLFYLDNSNGGSIVSYTCDLTGLLFEVNGYEYDTIRIVYSSVVSGNTIVQTLETGQKQGVQAQNVFGSALQYYYSLESVGYYDSRQGAISNTYRRVYRGFSVGTYNVNFSDGESETLCNDYNAPYWVDLSGKFLKIINDSETIVTTPRYSGMTTRQILTYESNLVTTDIGTGDVFSLLTHTFESIVPILSIAILPNLTIGMLIFIPLIVTIIIVVVKMIKG